MTHMMSIALIGISIGSAFSGLLTIAYTVLKLTKLVNWSWVRVLSPVWFSFACYVILVLIIISFKL
jgi:hypothetical protein